MSEATPKRIYRLPDEGQILGVCAGIADYFRVDPTLVRVIALILLFATQGFIVIAYLLSALIIPEKSTKSKSSAAKTENTNSVVESLQIKSTKSENFLNYTGAGLILLGVWLLLEQLFPSIFRWDWRIVWPAILVLIGLWIIVSAKGKK